MKKMCRETKKERQKIINSFYTDINLTKIVIAVMMAAGAMNILLYWHSLLNWGDIYSHMGKETASILNAVVGYYCICMSCMQNSYLSAVKSSHKNKRAEKLSDRNSNNRKSYETISILPVKKQELISMDMKILRNILLLLSVGLTGTNVIYMINPELERAAGYFVIITLNSLVIVVGDFLAKYYYKRIGYIMGLCGIILYCVVVIANLIANFNSKINHVVSSFLGLSIFKLIAGIPMIFLSVAVIPILYFIYKNTDFNRGQAASWRSV